MLIAASNAIYPDGHALATISMTFLKDYKKPPFGKSRQAKPIVKPLPSTVASSATAARTYVHPFQSTLAYSSSPSTCDRSIVSQLPEHCRRPSLSGSDSLPISSQISPPRGRSPTSYASKTSSKSLLEMHERTTPVHIPRPWSNNYLNKPPARPITYDPI